MHCVPGPSRRRRRALALALLAPCAALAQPDSAAAAPDAATEPSVAAPLGRADRPRPQAEPDGHSRWPSLALSTSFGRRSRTLWEARWREADPALDTGTLATATLQARRRNLDLRLTHRSGDRRDLQALVEFSTARPTSASLPNANFRLALGIDQRLADGAWLELRVGQLRSGTDQRPHAAAALTLRLSMGTRTSP